MKKILTTAILLVITGLFSLYAQNRVYTPEPVAPADLAFAQVPNVVLDWTAVTGGNTGIITYELWVDTDAGFASPDIFTTEFVSGYEMNELTFGQTYYWKVRAKDGGDVSDWSAVRSFSVLKRVETTKPLEAAANQKPNLTLEWTALTGITSYEYQFDTVGFWDQLTTPVTGNLAGAFSLDDTHGWLVGAGGKVLFFDGTALTEQTSTTTKDLTGVYFVDASNGWAVGKSGAIIYFNGTEWASQTSPTTKDLNAVCFVDATNGWAVGKDGVVIHYNGTDWTVDSYAAAKDLYALDFTDASHGFAVGKAGTAAIYNGTSWSDIPSNTARDLYSCAFLDANRGYAGGKSGLMMMYVNGTWKDYGRTVATKDIMGMYISGTAGWAVGKTGTVLQFDGTEWFPSSAGTGTNILGAAFSGTAGFIVGESGYAAAFSTEAFTSPMAQDIHTVAGTDKTVAVRDLLFGTTYYWRMRTMHSQGTSEWSGARSFTTMYSVVLDDPANNETGTGLEVTLKWDKVVDGITYEVQLDVDPTFSSPSVLETEEISATATMSAFGTPYYWRVRAIHAFDASDWPDPFKFTTIDQVTLLSPANNATDIKQTPLLSWQAIVGVHGYQVQVALNNTFADPIVNTLVDVANSSLSVPVVLEKNTQYFWRVRAYKTIDSCNWSNSWSFTTLPPVGISEPGQIAGLSVYPNPASNQLFVKMDNLSEESLAVTVSDLLGKPVIERAISFDAASKVQAIDVSSLPKGVYMLNVKSGKEQMTQKLIITR